MKYLALLATSFVLGGCTGQNEYKYQLGSIVCMVVDSRSVQIIRRFDGYYRIRVPVNKLNTNSKIIVSDNPISTEPYIAMNVSQFELKGCHATTP